MAGPPCPRNLAWPGLASAHDMVPGGGRLHFVVASPTTLISGPIARPAFAAYQKSQKGKPMCEVFTYRRGRSVGWDAAGLDASEFRGPRRWQTSCDCSRAISVQYSDCPSGRYGVSWGWVEGGRPSAGPSGRSRCWVVHDLSLQSPTYRMYFRTIAIDTRPSCSSQAQYLCVIVCMPVLCRAGAQSGSTQGSASSIARC